MSLQQLLSLVCIVIDDTCMRRAVEYLMSIFSREIVHSLVDVFIEAHDPLQVKCVLSVTAFLSWSNLLAVFIIHIFRK